MVCEKVLQDEGVLELLTVREVGVQLIPLEDGLFPLVQRAHRHAGIFTIMERHTVATSVMTWAVFGTITVSVRGVGERRKEVVEQVKTMRKYLPCVTASGPPTTTVPPEIGALLIVDRALAADAALHRAHQRGGGPRSLRHKPAATSTTPPGGAPAADGSRAASSAR